MNDKYEPLEILEPDCRTVGCGKNAECIRDGTEFVCRCPPGTTGSPNVECATGK